MAPQLGARPGGRARTRRARRAARRPRARADARTTPPLPAPLYSLVTRCQAQRARDPAPRGADAARDGELLGACGRHGLAALCLRAHPRGASERTCLAPSPLLCLPCPCLTPALARLAYPPARPYALARACARRAERAAPPVARSAWRCRCSAHSGCRRTPIRRLPTRFRRLLGTSPPLARGPNRRRPPSQGPSRPRSRAPSRAGLTAGRVAAAAAAAVAARTWATRLSLIHI